MRTRALLLVAWCMLALVLAPAAVADRILVTDKTARLESLSAYGGVLAWARSTGSQESPRTSYRKLVHGAVRPLAIRTRNGNGVIDLGPRHGGGVAAAYERCPSYPPEQESAGCRIYRYGLAGRRSSPVRGSSTRRQGARWPALWRQRVAFLRDTTGSAAGIFFTLFASPPLVRLVRVFGGPQDALEGPVTPSGMDLRGRVVAYDSTDVNSDEMTSTAILVRRFGRRGRGRSCVVARASEGATGAGHVSQPRLDGSYLYWKRESGYKVAIHRRRLPTRRCGRRGREQRTRRLLLIPELEPQGWNYAVTRGRVFYAVAGVIYEMQPVSFKDR